jgi:penicillin-binding protein 1A
MTLADGLAYSKNTITAQLMQQVGPARVAEVARAMGVRESKLEEVPSLALGTSPVTLKEMVTAYSSIANAGPLRRAHAHHPHRRQERQGAGDICPPAPEPVP